MNMTADQQPVVLILSPPVAGATWLANILAQNPHLFIAPDLHLLPYKTLPERTAALVKTNERWQAGLLRTIAAIQEISLEAAQVPLDTWTSQDLTIPQIYAHLQEWLGSRRLIEATPNYALSLETLQRAETLFDGALYLHLTRHPYGVLHTFETHQLDRNYAPDTLERDQHAFSCREFAELLWAVSTRNILDHLETVPQARQFTVRFETLAQDPQATLAAICGFLKLNCQARVVTASSSPPPVDAWRDDYTVDFLGAMTWYLAQTLGYRRES